jgi:hypothetical protein
MDEKRTIKIKVKQLPTVSIALSGCRDYRCVWCDHGEKYMWGMKPAALRKALTGMSQSEYAMRFYFPEGTIN